MVDVVIVGSVALDTIKTPFREVSEVLGGAAVYAGYAASFFAKPGIVAVAGNDFPGEHFETLAQRKVDLGGIKKEGKTFRWQGSYGYDMNQANTISTELNSFENFRPQIPEDYKKSGFVFLANINPELQLEVLDQIKKPGLVMLDTMNLWIETKKSQLLKAIRRSDLLMLNDGEARELFGTTNLVRAAGKALALGPDKVIIKKGEHGALLFTENGHFNAPGYPLEEIKDPTGCGDTFAGGLIGYLAKNGTSEKNLRKGIIYGSVLASFNAENFSLEGMRGLSERKIQARYEEFEKMREF